MYWNNETGWILEIDITYRCNINCRHCNRLCNAEHFYNITRTKLDMEEIHIDHAINEIKKYQKGKIKLVRVIGGEPILSPILNKTIIKLEELIKEEYIENLYIVSNGTIPIPNEIRKYIVYSPAKLSNFQVNGINSKKDVLMIKNHKHRNITIVPNDYGLKARICSRVSNCGINYSIYGFVLTSPCIPAIMMFPRNHKYFIHHLPISLQELVGNGFESNVCSRCAFALDKGYNIDMISCGKTWNAQVIENLRSYIEPDYNWIEKE